MKVNTVLKAALAAGLLGVAVLAQAGVEVRFVNPDRFTDAGRDEAQRQQTLQGIEQHLITAGSKQLTSGQDLLIEVLDVNLAGEEQPIPSRGAMLRVLRRATTPGMQLRYTLSRGGVVLRSGENRLSDLGYLDGINRYQTSDTLRYEKSMLDDWLRVEFSQVLASVKTAP